MQVMGDLKDLLATQLRQARQARDWTQEELADRAGLSPRYIGQIERGMASPSVTVLGRLAVALDMEPGALLRSPRRR
jgi:transcriptional regulator with XRE-family HTH domain